MRHLRRPNYPGRNKSFKSLFAIAIVVMSIVALIALVYLGKAVSGLFATAPYKTVVVPNLYNVDVDTANTILAQLNLGLRVKDSAFAENVPAGKIIWQFPSADSKVKEGRIIQVVKSLGSTNLIVPKVVGSDLKEAQLKIKQAKFSVGEIRKVYSEEYPRGNVISQTPEPLKTYPTPVKVDIVVADNRPTETLSMPNLVGKSLTRAEDELFTLNLQLAKVTYVNSDSSQMSIVIGQKPPAQDQVRLGSQVFLEVGLGEEDTEKLGSTFIVKYRHPVALPAGELVIEVEDAHGKSQVLKENVLPGALVEQSISATGKAFLRIYLNGKLIREERV